MGTLVVLQYVALAIAYVGVAVIVWGALIGIIAFICAELGRFRGADTIHPVENLRLRFGSYLLLGLEFLIAADVIKTIVNPTLTDVAILGGIVLIRTVISYFLTREINACRPSATDK